MFESNLANLTAQYQQAYLVYCYKVMQYIQAYAWLAEQQKAQKQAQIKQVKGKTASGVKKLESESNQQNHDFKSLMHQEKIKPIKKLASESSQQPFGRLAYPFSWRADENKNRIQNAFNGNIQSQEFLNDITAVNEASIPEGIQAGAFGGNGLGILASPESPGFSDAVGGTLSGMARNMGNDLLGSVNSFNNTFIFPATDALGSAGDALGQYDGMFNTIASMGPFGKGAAAAEFYGAKFLSGFSKIRGLIGGGNSVWDLNPLVRGNIIESTLAQTTYKDWFNVGQLNNGFFPLVDFQKGNVLVSMKSVDTNGGSWMNAMQNHIRDLGKGTALVNNKVANMVLDIRVQPGGAKAAEDLVEFGIDNGVSVMIKEF